MNTNNKNPLLCDPGAGICELPDSADTAVKSIIENHTKQIRVIYFTDPICSSCWGIEPQLRRMKLEYGHVLHIEYHMGGLLPDWSYNSGGISKPSDVAHHWDEVSTYYNMPIDGDIWLEDPLPSSYPPSIAFKAAQLQDEVKAIRFLRRLREMVFLEKKNITRWEHMVSAASVCGLDTTRLQLDYENEARQLFQADLALARQLGVRGFPSLFFTDSSGKQEFVYGFKPYSVFEHALKSMLQDVKALPYKNDWQCLFGHYPSLTTREFAELSGITIAQSEEILESLFKQGYLTTLVSKRGILWMRK